ncbi:MAG: hypothetical protein ACE363_09675 [Alphaproteobacteria bacterium]
MSRLSGIARIAALSGLSLVLASCSIFGGGIDLEIPESLKQKCPPVGIVAYTGEVFRFSGDGRESSDLAYQGQISGLSVECTDSEDGQGLFAVVAFDVSAVRGPSGGGSVELPYFVSVTRGSEAVLEKNVYSSFHGFGARNRSAQREAINAYVPLGADGEILDLEILIGFQLTREELAYNVAR